MGLPEEAIAEIERSLSRHVGPLAKVLIRKSRGEAPTLDEFFRALADHIPEGDEQQLFMKKVAAFNRAPEREATASRTQPAAPRPVSTAESMTGLTPEALATAERRLASYVGPLARFLIKDAAGQTGNIKELYAQLATHIDSEDERRAFLASLGR